VRFLRVLAGVLVPSVGLTMAGTSGAGAEVAHPAPTSISRSAHLPYQGCPARDIELTVTLSARTYRLGQNVRYTVRLHNRGANACSGGGHAEPGLPGRTGAPSLGLGPCDSLPMAITDAHGAPVYPGTGGIACPMLLGPPLGAHSTQRASGTWDRVEGGLRPARIPTPAPPGRYRLVVGTVVSVPFTLTNAPPVPALTADTLGGPPSAAEAQAGGLPATPIG
jgi:hypothetical protein